MAEGQAPTPEIKQGSGPDALPWGEAAQVNDLIGLAPPPTDTADEFKPRSPQEDFLFSPTDRPGEPFSAGLPFGAGPNAQAPEDDTQFAARVSKQLLNVPNPPKELKAFVARMAEGL